MPRRGTPTRQQVEQALAVCDEFVDRLNWQRSKRGNLWRHWNGITLTIFSRSDNSFGWSWADEERPRFSSNGYADEAAAIDGLAWELGIGCI